MPFEEEQVNEAFKRSLKDILKKFEAATKDFADVDQLIEFRNNIQDEIESDFQTRMQKSEEMSQHLCKVLINEFFNSFELSSLFDNKELKESTLIEYKEKFQTFYENYKLFAKGAHKCKQKLGLSQLIIFQLIYWLIVYQISCLNFSRNMLKAPIKCMEKTLITTKLMLKKEELKKKSFKRKLLN